MPKPHTDQGTTMQKKIIADTQKTQKPDLRAADIVNAVFKFYFGKELKLAKPIKMKGLPPDLHVIGCSTPNDLPGMEAIGLALHKLRNKKMYQHLRVLYFLPLPGHILLSKTRVYVLKGCFIDKQGFLQPVTFKTPVLVDTPIFYAYKGAQFHINDQRLIKLAKDKHQSYNFLKKNGIPTTAQQEFVDEPKNIRKSIDLVSDHGQHPFVIKPVDLQGGHGVKMFDPGEHPQGTAYARESLLKSSRIVIERRIPSYPVYDEQGRRLDWNIRKISTFDTSGKPVAHVDLAEVRINTYSNDPVSVSQGGRLENIRSFIKKLPITDRQRKKVMKELIEICALFDQAIIDTFISGEGAFFTFPSALLGLDLILGEDLHWYFIEFNASAVGGIQNILRISKYNIDLVVPVLRSLAKTRPDIPEEVTKLLPPKEKDLRKSYLNKLVRFSAARSQ